MHVLGLINVIPSHGQSDQNYLYASIHPKTNLPRILLPRNRDLTVQIIMFDKPDPSRMQYMSLTPISLALGSKIYGDDDAFPDLNLEGEVQKERARKARLVNKLGLHTVVRHPPTQKEMLLPTILNQMNCSSELGRLLSNNVHLLRPRQKRVLSVGERVVESATTLWDHALAILWHVVTVWLYPVATRAFVIGLLCHRIIAEVILRVLEWRIRPESLAFKDVSATAQQVDIRLQQFCYWPIQYLTLRKRKDEWESITDRHPEYIRFYNSLWLVANDVIIGIALGSYIIDNAEWVAFQINDVLSSWTIEGLRDMIVWLTDAPAGLKLNNELATFLGALFIWVIDHWKGIASSLQ
ncbi:MAG: hypothetical protein Q9190_001200 [Brigantiaea leucoxantha]